METPDNTRCKRREPIHVKGDTRELVQFFLALILTAVLAIVVDMSLIIIILQIVHGTFRAVNPYVFTFGLFAANSVAVVACFVAATTSGGQRLWVTLESGSMAGSFLDGFLVREKLSTKLVVVAVRVIAAATGFLLFLSAGGVALALASAIAEAGEQSRNHSGVGKIILILLVRITKPYYLGVTEVPQGQWEEVMGTRPWEGESNAKSNPSHAVSYVSWEDAVEFCEKLSLQEGREYRLPTEAEWEYACRAGSRTRFSFGDNNSDLGSYAWYDENTLDVDEKYAHAVGVKRANAWGLHDMHGNMHEWRQDGYSEDYYENSLADNRRGRQLARSACIAAAAGATIRGAAGRRFGLPSHRRQTGTTLRGDRLRESEDLSYDWRRHARCSKSHVRPNSKRLA